MIDLRKIFESPLAHRSVYVLALLIMLIIIISCTGSEFTGSKGLVINEAMASNRSTIADEEGDYPDWLEIYNPGNQPLNLQGYRLSNNRDNPFMWEFPDITIQAEDYLIIFASGKNQITFEKENPYIHTNFRLSASGSDLYLIDPDLKIIDNVSLPPLLSNVSYGRTMENRRKWAFFLDATPGAANEAHPLEQVTLKPSGEEKHLIINEIITDNRTSLADEDGDLVDWIELYNPGTESINLDRYWLSDKYDNPFKWRFPSVTIEADQYLVVFASGKNRHSDDSPYLHTNFKLNDRNDTLVLCSPDGTMLNVLKIPVMERNVSYGRDPEDPDQWLYFPRPTPGEINYTQGFEQFSNGPVPNLQISEAMAVNETTISDQDGDYTDWIEIYNPDSYVIDLTGYGLSDQEDQPFRWQFPALAIGPQERLIVFASGKDRAGSEEEFLHTNFKLDPTGETLVLTHPDGFEIDRLSTGKLQPDQSIGRSPDQEANRVYFAEPQPGLSNESAGYPGYSRSPQLIPPGGFYNGSLQVELKPPATGSIIYYTLDGSKPDENSNQYSNPLTITETTVLRAMAVEPDMLPSPIENRTYFINREHQLTVISVMIDPLDLWDYREGIYVEGPGAVDRYPYYGANFWKDMEKAIHLELYEPDGTLGASADAGIKIGGQFSRGMDQKIFNVFFRNIYGYNRLHYPLFLQKNITEFKAITLRTSGQDSVYSKIRDIMMTSLLENTGLDYQDHRQAVLYLNGEYWGIYNIRERANRYFVADNHGLDPDKIDLLQANWIVRAGSNEDYLDMLQFVINNDMSRAENYEYIKTRMEIENYIDALIVQIYCAQTDQGNIRYWREQGPDGRWRWIVYDLDWGFWLAHVEYNTLASMTDPAGTGAWNNISTALTVNLLKNKEFEHTFVERFAYHLTYTFAPERVIRRIDELAANIEAEMPNQVERWGGSMDRWFSEIEDLRKFARQRPDIVIEQIRQKFNLSPEEVQVLFD